MNDFKLCIGSFMLITTFFYQFQAAAQTQVIKLQSFQRGVSLGYELKVNKISSITLSTQYSGKSIGGIKFFGVYLEPALYRARGWGGTIEGRVYNILNNKPLSGFYFAPHISFQYHKLVYREVDDEIFQVSYGVLNTTSFRKIYAIKRKNVNTLGVGVKFGFQKTWKHFNIDGGFSLFHNFVLNTDKSLILNNGSQAEYYPEINGTKVHPYVGLGVAF